MKTSLVLVMVLLMGTMAPAFSQPWQTSNTGCDASSNCIAETGCSYILFTPNATDTYTISAWTQCTDTNCDACMSCVNVYDGTTTKWLANCHTNGCDGGDCDYVCPDAVTLQSGHTYRLSVCLLPCATSNCTECDAGCTAYGSVSP